MREVGKGENRSIPFELRFPRRDSLQNTRGDPRGTTFERRFVDEALRGAREVME